MRKQWFGPKQCEGVKGLFGELNRNGFLHCLTFNAYVTVLEMWLGKETYTYNA